MVVMIHSLTLADPQLIFKLHSKIIQGVPFITSQFPQ